MAKSLKLARSQLNAVLLSVNDQRSWLPEKEQIAPNQLSWPPTAARMGVKHGENRRHGKVDSALMAEHISVPKHKRPMDDPYGAGEDSGKCTKPDAVLAAANAWAHMAEERASLKAAECPPSSLPAHLPPSPSPACLPPPPASYVPMTSMHMLMSTNSMHAMHVPPVYWQPPYPASQPVPLLYPPRFLPYTTYRYPHFA